MAPNLPIELWIIIVRIAVTKWPSVSFNPRSDQFSRIEGFCKACEQFKQAAEYVRHDNFVGNFDQFVFLDSPCNQVQFIRLRDMLPERQLNTQAFLNHLSDYAKLKSLSICSPNPLSIIAAIHTLSFASTLRRLDLNLVPKADFTLSVPISLPQLEELRLGLREGAKRVLSLVYLRSILDLCPLRTSRPEEFVTNLAKQLAGSPKLRLLSLCIAWDNEHDLRSLIASHELDIHRAEENRPADHTGCFYECTACIKGYDHAAVIWKENAAAWLLSEAIPSLRRVMWTKAWGPILEDEAAQRGISIEWNNGVQSLKRDDGL